MGPHGVCSVAARLVRTPRSWHTVNLVLLCARPSPVPGGSSCRGASQAGPGMAEVRNCRHLCAEEEDRRGHRGGVWVSRGRNCNLR